MSSDIRESNVVNSGTGAPAVSAKPLDTVAVAAADSEGRTGYTYGDAGSFPWQQPYAELGLAPDEYARIIAILGRRPTMSELAMYSVMWSEHCSYKSSRVHLRQFADRAPDNGRLLVGIGENAGVIDVGDDLAVTFKIESHNHPSYVEPYQGAATGVGGIVRDILTMGARPVAVMDALRFGPADAPDTRRVLPGVVAGIGGYGNCLGLPNVGGELVFDPCYVGNPLVNALCVGVLRKDQIKLAQASGPGNKVVLFGARTGGDGIGGASVLASATFEGGGAPRKRPAVQVGDPFAEKVLIECCLEIFAADLVVGIQDLGAAGLSCATTELAAAGTGGMSVDLDLVPLRDPTLTPEEILMSESQERMMAVVAPERVEEFFDVCERWDVTATVIGEVTAVTGDEELRGGRLLMRWHGETIVDVPPRTLAHEAPVYDRARIRPSWLDALRADAPTAERLARPATGEELRETVLRLAGSPNLADKGWVTDQYDRYVLGNTVLAQPDDAGMIRLDAALAPGATPTAGDHARGIALATDGNGRYTMLDPYTGAQLALAEAYRNVAASGATPVAVTDCLNFGSPEDPAVMWQFAEATRGLADACQSLGVPVTGGNVSFYNQTGDTAIQPTPVVGVLGLIDDVSRRTPMASQREGDVLVLLGATREEFGGSEWAHVVHGHLGGLPPAVDLGRERALGALLVAGARDGLLAAAHDLSGGGLAQALVEMCVRSGRGADVDLAAAAEPLGGDLFTLLFSESTARALVAVAPADEERLGALCDTHHVPYHRVGTVAGERLAVRDAFEIGLDELRAAHTETLAALFGN